MTFSQVNAQIASKIDSLVAIHVKKGFNGNVYYSKSDSIVYKGNFGVSNFELNKSLNDSTLFELASNTKQFTALAIIQLIEAGKLDYKTEVQSVLDSFPYKNISVEHLLKHQSGLPEYAILMKKRKVWRKENIADKKMFYLLFENLNQIFYSNQDLATNTTILDT